MKYREHDAGTNAGFKQGQRRRDSRRSGEPANGALAHSKLADMPVSMKIGVGLQPVSSLCAIAHHRANSPPV
jgi:hypothetical protein